MNKKFNPISSPFKPLSFGKSLKILRSHSDWIVQEAPASPWYWWLSSLAWIHGLASEGYSPGSFFTYVTKEIGTLTIEHDVFMKIARRLVRSEIKNRSVVTKWMKRWKAQNRDYHLFVGKIRKADLKSLNDRNLAKSFQDFCQLYYEVETLPLSNEFLIPYSDSILKREMEENPQAAEAIAHLITPRKKSFLQREEDKLKKISKFPISKRKLALQTHLEKWYFIGAGYEGPHYATLRELQKRLNRLKTAKHAIARHDTPRVKLRKEIRVLITLSRKVAEWKDERKRNNLIGSCVLEVFAREFSRRFRIPFSLLRYAVPRDFTRMGTDPRLKGELSKRLKSGAAWGMSGRKHSAFYLGSQYGKIREIISSFKKSSETLSGIVAYPGKVKGRICMVHHPSQDKFRDREILLTSMTRPEFVPLIRKARAVLCDEGGLLSHAAIVSRELKIPCLVGLKHAMASLKTGDMVEVDANSGIVRKIL